MELTPGVRVVMIILGVVIFPLAIYGVYESIQIINLESEKELIRGIFFLVLSGIHVFSGGALLFIGLFVRDKK